MKLPCMPWYPSTHIAEAQMLSLEEDGAFRRILDQLWLKGGWLPDDPVKIARLLNISKIKWLKIRPELEKFFDYYEGKFTQQRLLENYDKALKKVEINRKNGSVGGRKRMQTLDSSVANASPYARTKTCQTLQQALKPLSGHYLS